MLRAPLNSVRLTRLQQLREVFSLFDLAGSGAVESHKLLLLGQAWGSTRQWTEHKNAELVSKIDADGLVGSAEFAECFERVLPGDAAEFDETISNFKLVAAQCHTTPAARATEPVAESVSEAVAVLHRIAAAPSNNHSGSSSSTASSPSTSPETAPREMTLVQKARLWGQKGRAPSPPPNTNPLESSASKGRPTTGRQVNRI